MHEAIRILLVEDSEDDAMLLLGALRAAGQAVDAERVERAEDFEAALRRRVPDVIVCDFTLPAFDALAALRIVKRLAVETPFIVVSGSVSETTAIDALRAGADDYVMKGNLVRLAPAIARAMREHEARRERRRAEEALREASRATEERYRALFENAMIGLFRSTPDGRYLDANPALARMFGYATPAEMIDAVANIPRQQVAEHDARVEFAKLFAETGRVEGFIGQGQRKDGSLIWVNMTAQAVRDASGRVTHIEGSARDVTDRIEAERALRAAEERYRGIFENALEGIYRSSPAGRFLEANPAMARMLGYGSPAELIEQVRDIKSELYYDADEFARFRAAILGEGRTRDYVVKLRRRDGTPVWASLSARIVRNDEGEIAYFEGIAEDITVRVVQAERIERLNRIRDVLGAINATIVRAQSREELAVQACRIAVSAGRFCAAWFGVVDRDVESLVPIAAEGFDDSTRRLLAVNARSEDSDRARTIMRAMAEQRPMFVNDLRSARWPDLIRHRALALGANAFACLPLVVDAKAVAALVLYAQESIIGDDEERRLLTELTADLSFALDHLAKAERLKYLAYYDVLTGLPNRALFEDRLTQQLAIAAQANGTRAILVFDLQRFRHVNETLGRHAGDALLKAVARRVAAAFPRGCTLARTGGDVFAMSCNEELDAASIAQKIDHTLLGCFAAPFAVDGTELRLTPRIGIALFPIDGRDTESLMRNAEAALKQAKQSGQRYLFYAPEMNARIASVLSLEHRLRQAIDRDELVLHYQPQVSAINGRVMGFEALVRWQTPDEGLWGPARFIPIAEELGLIVDLGRWVFEEACRQTREWRDAGLTEFTMAVNVSALQLQTPGFLDDARRAIVGRGLSPREFEIELTESAIMEQIERMSESLNALKRLGVSIALDDFGVGYSSLHYLKRLPIDKLKIDQSFVREISTNQGDAAIVRAIVAMGHQLRMKVMAEGVETAAQFGYLRRNHCDEVQGRFFSMPLPAAEAQNILRQRYLNADAFAQAPQTQTLLLLDDDAHILQALKRLLRRDGLRIFTANNAAEAFAILAREDVQVVISDQRMPDTSGTEFLNRVKDMYPDTIRMVLSGFTDLKSVTDAINRGAIYKFLTKPWDDAELRAQIREAFRTYSERRANSRAA